MHYGFLKNLLHHQRPGYDEGINRIRFGLADVVLPHIGSLNGVDEADLVSGGDKEANKVVAVVSCRFKADDAVTRKSIQVRSQQTEAIGIV